MFLSRRGTPSVKRQIGFSLIVKVPQSRNFERYMVGG
jgi:hypothetical protein